MTEFHVEVVRLADVRKHPNADTLSIATIHDAYPVIFKTGEFKEGDLVVYVPVDSVVPDTPEWAWLAPGAALRPKDRRIKAKRLRGVFSMGLITNAPEGAQEGQDVAQAMGIVKYEPPAEAGESLDAVAVWRREQTAWAKWRAEAPWWQVFLVWLLGPIFGWGPEEERARPRGLKHLPGVYDIEPYRKHGRSWFNEGEYVVVTEKIHGQNASFVHDGKQLFAKSRTRWRHDDGENTWSRVARRYRLKEKLARHPGVILFGETHGNNSDMPYGVTPAERAAEGDRFMAFDAFDTNTGRWLDYRDFVRLCTDLGVPRVPVLSITQWHEDKFDAIAAHAEGKTTMPDAGHVREGFVIRPLSERKTTTGQRVILKMAGEGYLTRKGA